MRVKIIVYSLLFCCLASSYRVSAQTEHQRQMFKALSDELRRNVDSLSIKNLEKPFFIQYALQKGRIFQVQATLGGITGINEFPLSSMSVNLLVGNSYLANNNLSNTDYRFGAQGDTAPIDDNYDEIRRRLWLLTDKAYKAATEEYSNKMTSLKQLNLTQEVIDLPDFTALPAVTHYGKADQLNYNRSYWEKTARDCSAVFKKYPDIHGSNVGIEIFSGEIFSVNSEGVQLVHPVRLVAFAVNAFTKLEDGEEISDRLSYYGLSEADIPDAGKLVKYIDEMARNIMTLSKAPKIDESYTGPVIIEGTGFVSDMAALLLSSRTGLVAFRTPLKSGGIERLMEDRLNRRILSGDISVRATPKMKNYNGQTLIGAYEIDSEGIIPEDDFLLVENGMLRALLSDRVPTKKIKTPTGNRVYAYQPQGISTRVSPGVFLINSSNGLSRDSLKARLIEAARNEGLEYAYIIRSLPAGRNAALFKLSLHDGSEQPVRSAVPARIDMSKLKRALGSSAESIVLNMIAGGIPVSVICPDAIIIDELDIEKRNLQNTTKLPIVSNPIMSN